MGAIKRNYLLPPAIVVLPGNMHSAASRITDRVGTINQWVREMEMTNRVIHKQNQGH